MRVTIYAVLAATSFAGSALGSITWDGARFIRNGLAEWYDDIGGNGVSNIYFESDGTRMYEGDAPTGGHWLDEEFAGVGVYEYTFKASNNLGNTSITTYNLELNFDGAARFTAQATTSSDFTGGAFYSANGLQVELSHFSFDILPLGSGGVDEVGNLGSTPDGAADIVGRVVFTVTSVPAPASAGLFGLAIGAGASRRRRG